MANPTTNFGWVMPNSADLVTDLPADFAVFGQGVDTSMQYLLGGTTGQVLSKTSGTNMAFTWINNDQGDITGVTAGTGISVSSPTGPVPTVSIDTAVTADLTTAQTFTNKKLSDSTTTIVDVTDATKAIKFDVAGTTGITGTIATAFTTAKTVTIPDTTGTVALTNGVVNNTLTTTTGDIIYASAANTPARLGIGSASQVLSVSGGIPAWATVSSGALTLITSATFSGSTAISVNSCFSSTYTNYMICIQTTVGSTNTLTWKWRASGTDSSASYYWSYAKLPFAASPSWTLTGATGSQTSASLQTFDTNSYLVINVSKVFATDKTMSFWQMSNDQGAGHSSNGAFMHYVSSSYDGFTFTSDVAPTGKYWVYGLGN